MTTKTIVFGPYDPAATGLTANLVSGDGASVVQSGITVANAGTARSWWKFDVTADLAVALTLYRYELLRGGNAIGGGVVWADDTAGTYYADVSPATNSDGSVNATVDLSGVPPISVSVVVPPAVANASQTPSLIQCIRGDLLSRDLPVMGNLAGRTNLVFTAKLPEMVINPSNTDSQAIIQVSENGGLTVLNGSSTGLTSSNASLTVTDEATGALRLFLKAAVTSVIPIEDLLWDCQATFASGTSTPIGGQFSMTADVTQAIS